MPHEMMVGLDVIDPAVYREYRAAMRPLLEAAGGGFRYDFEIARTLRSEASHAINRVFAIYFRDRAARESFFGNPDYAAIRKRFFERSVQGTTILAEYDRA